MVPISKWTQHEALSCLHQERSLGQRRRLESAARISFKIPRKLNLANEPVRLLGPLRSWDSLVFFSIRTTSWKPPDQTLCFRTAFCNTRTPATHPHPTRLLSATPRRNESARNPRRAAPPFSGPRRSGRGWPRVPKKPSALCTTGAASGASMCTSLAAEARCES